MARKRMRCHQCRGRGKNIGHVLFHYAGVKLCRRCLPGYQGKES